MKLRATVLIFVAAGILFPDSGDISRTQSLTTAAAHANQNSSLKGDAERGKLVFHRCRACHSITPVDPDQPSEGDCSPAPSLRGVIGRKAGAVKGCSYSLALQNASLVWDEASLDAWLQDPNGYLPGNRMAFQALTSQQARADLIAFLRSTSSNSAP